MRKLFSHLHVAVLSGGASDEREVSLKSGREVLKALRGRCRVTSYDPAHDLARLVRDAKKIDVAFLALHGRFGEDGAIQGLLEMLGIPYTGSGVLASALAMDKAVAKEMYRDAGVPTPHALTIKKSDWQKNPGLWLKKIRTRLGTQIVVKPNASGSSVGVRVRPPQKDWKSAIQKALRSGESCLVEAWKAGRELTVAVVEKKGKPSAFPVIEIRTKRAFFDYIAKYTKGGSEEICPADVPAPIARKAQTLAIKSHVALGCRGYSRTDMIWTSRGIEILETNTLPGLTRASLLPKAAAAQGIAFPDLIVRLIQEAI